jgi:hypothetical protein
MRRNIDQVFNPDELKEIQKELQQNNDSLVPVPSNKVYYPPMNYLNAYLDDPNNEQARIAGKKSFVITPEMEQSK